VAARIRKDEQHAASPEVGERELAAADTRDPEDGRRRPRIETVAFEPAGRERLAGSCTRGGLQRVEALQDSAVLRQKLISEPAGEQGERQSEPGEQDAATQM